MLVECPRCGVRQSLDRALRLRNSINWKHRAALNEVAAMDRSPLLKGWREGAEIALDRSIQEHFDTLQSTNGFHCISCRYVARWGVVGWKRVENMIEIAVRVE